MHSLHGTRSALEAARHPRAGAGFSLGLHVAIFPVFSPSLLRLLVILILIVAFMGAPRPNPQ